MNKSLLLTFFSLFLILPLMGQEKKKPEAEKPEIAKPAGFNKTETTTFIIEVTNALPQSFLQDAKNKVLAADAFFTQTFRMPAGILTGNLNENSAAFTKFTEKLKAETKFSGKIPKNIYEEWFGLAGKIHLRIWDKRVLFGEEFFDFINEPKEKRAGQGLPGAYYATGRLGGTDNGKNQLGRRIIRSYTEGREPKEVIASLYHELGHLYLGSYLMDFQSKTPAWLAEGFAELFAYALPSDKKTKRQIERNKAVIYAIVQTGEYWKFDEFLEITNAHNLKLVADKSIKSEIIYTQAWSVVQFLTSNPAFSTKFLNFLDTLRTDYFASNLLTNGDKRSMFVIQRTAFKETFGTDMVNLEKFWVKYVNIKYKGDLDIHPEYNFYIGDFYLRRGDLKKAQEFFALAAEKAPKFCESHLGLGRLAYTQKQYEEAAIHFEDAVKADPENGEAYAWLGYSYIATGKNEKANETFEKAILNDETDEDTLSGYGLSLFYSGKYEKSALYYGKAYDKSKNPNNLLGQAKSLFLSKEYTAARRIFSTLSTTMDDPEIPFWIGAASAYLKEKEYALTELTKASKSNNRYSNYAKAFIEALNNDTALPEIKP